MHTRSTGSFLGVKKLPFSTSDISHFSNLRSIIIFFISDFPCYMTYRRHILQHPKCNSLDPKCNFRSSSDRSSPHLTHHITIIPLINFGKCLASGFTSHIYVLLLKIGWSFITSINDKIAIFNGMVDGSCNCKPEKTSLYWKVENHHPQKLTTRSHNF